jgi:membrane-associated protease RseP (regulator of RpoE activity)
MNMGLVYTAIAILIYALILILLKVRDVYSKEGISLWGPFLMWRTQKGKKLIERLAKRKRFFSGYASFAIGLVFVTMFFMMLLLIWSATLVSRIPRESAPGPELLIAIPGVNPIIPIWFGIIALAVAIVIHEFAHGILTRVANLTVKSLGVVLCVVPIGAFVEPDEEEIKATTRKKRMRLFAVGPATNIIFALVCALLFSWVFIGSVAPVHDGVMLAGALDDSPGYDAGINKLWMEITDINGTPIADYDDFESVPAPKPLESVTVTYFYKNELSTVDVLSGVVILHVTEDYPAHDAGIEAGMIFVEFDGVEIRNDKDFRDFMGDTSAGQSVNITLYRYNETSDSYIMFNTSATLEDKYEYYEENYPASVNDEDYKGKGFLGVSHSYLGVQPGGNPGAFMDRLSRPLSSADSSDEALLNMAVYTLLPFQRLSPFPSSMTDLYTVEGPLGVLPAPLFWFMADLLYWLFWLNLMVGLTNALPAGPLDGGYIFKDGLDGLITRVNSKLSQEKREAVVRRITLSLSFFILFLIIWQVIGPRVL